jgi:RimJ/RimL family protein N-acetyltransferase
MDLSMSPVQHQATSPAPAKPTPDPHHGWAWVPIRSLAPRHRPRITEHLIGLSEVDRYLRFGYPATDAQITKYVDTLDFDRDEVFGIFNRRLDLIAMAHLANTPGASREDQDRVAEFGVSVSNRVRGRGYGARLFEHAVMHARNRGVASLFIHALSENTAMLKIARNAGASVERDGSESEAWLKLPPVTIATRVGEMVEQQAAELDYQLKVQAHRVNEFLEILQEVKTHIKARAPSISE